jgi:SAM-dependent methyltransferase
VAKADVLNRLVDKEDINSVLELGCGDGNQLSLANYASYVGVDVSAVAIEACQARFFHDQSKRFFVAGTEPLPDCELGLSLDVIYHLVEDHIFEAYMHDLVSHSSRFLVLYTSDCDVFTPTGDPPPHIRHRPVSSWMASEPYWHLRERIPNPYPFQKADQINTSFADFYIFERDPDRIPVN